MTGFATAFTGAAILGAAAFAIGLGGAFFAAVLIAVVFTVLAMPLLLFFEDLPAALADDARAPLAFDELRDGLLVADLVVTFPAFFLAADDLLAAFFDAGLEVLVLRLFDTACARNRHAPVNGFALGTQTGQNGRVWANSSLKCGENITNPAKINDLYPERRFEGGISNIIVGKQG